MVLFCVVKFLTFRSTSDFFVYEKCPSRGLLLCSKIFDIFRDIYILLPKWHFTHQNGGIYCHLACFFILLFYSPPPGDFSRAHVLLYCSTVLPALLALLLYPRYDGKDRIIKEREWTTAVLFYCSTVLLFYPLYSRYCSTRDMMGRIGLHKRESGLLLYCSTVLPALLALLLYPRYDGKDRITTRERVDYCCTVLLFYPLYSRYCSTRDMMGRIGFVREVTSGDVTHLASGWRRGSRQIMTTY